MKFVVIFRRRGSLWNLDGYLTKIANDGFPQRGRKKSKRTAPFHWGLSLSEDAAEQFEDAGQAIKLGRRASGKFDKDYEVWTFVNEQTGRKVWPAEDIIGAIGLLATASSA